MNKKSEDIQHIYDAYYKDSALYQELQADKEKRAVSKWRLFNNANNTINANNPSKERLHA